MNIKTEKASAEQVILGILGEDHTEPVTPYRLAQESDLVPRRISAALYQLVRDGMVDQMTGGRYRLTDAGLAMIAHSSASHPLNVIQEHPGPSALDTLTGQVSIGINSSHNDVRIPLWDAFGAKSVVASGATGSGKTELMGGLIESATGHYPNVRTWLVDSTRQLSHYWGRVQRIGSDFDQDDSRVSGSASDVLRDVIAVQHDRSKFLAETGSRCWNSPFGNPSLPAGLLILSSLNELRDWEFFGLLRTVMKMARKTGIVVATDVSDLSVASFNDFAIRDGFLYGTVLRMRSTNPLDAQIGNPHGVSFPALDKRFTDDQTTAGVGYLPDGKLFRSFWTPGL